MTAPQPDAAGNAPQDGAAGATVEVVTLGECLVAFVATSIGPLAEVLTFERHVAGAEANVAVGLARLGHRVGFIGRVGADAFGTAIVRRLRGEGVVVLDMIVDASAPTGLLIRERRLVGAAQVLYQRSGSAGSRLEPADIDAAASRGLFAAARWLHLTGITPALSASARAALERAVDLARASGMTVSIDLNLRRKLWSAAEFAEVMRRLAGRADVVLGGADEVGLVTGIDPATRPAELAAGLLELGPATAIVTLGPDGAVGASKDGMVFSPATPIVPLDPVGAGDAFAAGYIAATLEGGAIEHALHVGNTCGAAAVSVIGDLDGLPDRAELDGLLRADAKRSPDTIR